MNKVQEFTLDLAENLSIEQIYSEWLTAGDEINDYRCILSLGEEYKKVFPGIDELANDNRSGFVSYFRDSSCFFINQEILEKMLGGKIDVYTDYSLMFDTNFASYIYRFVRRKDLHELTDKVNNIIDSIIKGDYNYDYYIYLIENAKQINEIYEDSNHIDLDKYIEIKETLIALELFKSIDKDKYIDQRKVEITITEEEAEENAKELINEMYASESGKFLCKRYISMQKATALNLIGILKIQFMSKKNYINKMLEYIDFMENKLGTYTEREAFVAYEYFKNRDNLSILKKINKGREQKGLIEKINNIAWDFSIPRITEDLMRFNEQFYMPTYISIDNGLRELLRLFPVKGIVYNDKVSYSIPANDTIWYNEDQRLMQRMMEFNTPKSKEKRKQIVEYNRNNDFSIIEQEYKELLDIMSK